MRRLRDALSELPGYKFRYLNNHGTLERDLSELSTDLVFNLCDEGWNNDPFKELHVPALMEVLGIAYTGAGPSALAACYDKGLVRAVAHGLDVPVPLESYVRPGDQGATGRCRHAAVVIAGDALAERGVIGGSRIGIGRQPLPDQEGILGAFGGLHQMQPTVLAANADMAAIGRNENIRLRHARRPQRREQQ